ncbi:polysaccharide lyase family 8 super-sandwich domain-containing protein [Coraliomargarita sp. SDUM461003]|uniref:Polysaccharide lyase family 8 super-sandwich domain-containing protein n=1 Tax=Thalassobacterium maritimum TaxID=3041265 RepID=A0ABU1ATD6_9BACT|nr:polysaccharide lyase family 8 super-sandwich domain-containing protein [Coraliomargarita sp. SDUM461003]MDQ8207318.1 polysaccharide lyase family 8 super-sandwich domain-containing protein [Coraliomargarita sp. SDUM461003]
MSHLIRFLLFFLLATHALLASEIDTLRLRIHADFVAKTDRSEAANFLADQQVDGSWADINYSDRDRSRWTPILHLRRIRAIASAYYSSNHALYQDAVALAGIEAGLGYWLTTPGIYSDNWWHQEVNTAQQLGAILMMCYDDLTAQTLTDGAAELAALKALRSDNYWSSQNTIYTSFSRIYLEILNHDQTALETQLNRIKVQAAYKTGLGRTSVTNNNSKEGVRVDYSFYQHGAALYNGFYGAHYVTDMGFWIAMLEGLSFEFSDEQIEVIQDYVLEGHQWTNRYGVLDPNITNRKISHDNYDYVTLRYHDPIVYGLEYLRALATPLPRAAELEAFYQHIVNDGPSQIAGNREFWKTDFMVQAGDGYQVSTKLWSYHNEGTEYINGDGRQGQFLSVGGTFLMQDAEEHLEIFPIWDWGRVPGTTTLHRDPAGAPSGNLGTQKFAGGISNGTEGAMAYDHAYDSVTAKKSWFYFDDVYVMLGAGINGGNGSLNVNTTVNQIFLEGDVSIGIAAGESLLGSGEFAPTDLEWVHHDNTGYLLPAGGDVQVAAKSQSGSWYEINDSLPSTTLTDDVFSLWFDHGLAPVDDSYACVVVPAVDKPEFDSWRGANPIEILANTAQLQAVRHAERELMQFAFHVAGSFTTPNGYFLEVNHPCLVMLDETEEPALITVSDPTQELGSLLVSLEAPDGTPRSLYYVLPAGDEAGRSTSESSAYNVGSVDPIDMSGFAMQAYHTDQDNAGGATVSANGLEIHFTGNTWQALNFVYTITSDTVLEFEIEGSDVGELVSIGLDEDLTVNNAPRIFVVGGSENASAAAGWNYTPRYSAGAASMTYQIPIGNYYTGTTNYLVFTADDDANASIDVSFKNIKLYENAAEPTHYSLYILAGQSHASGRANFAGNVADSEADAQVIYYYDTDTTGASVGLRDSGGTFTQLGPTSNDVFGPEIAIGRTLIEFDEASPAIVKFSRGGTDLFYDWDPDAETGMQLYSQLLSEVQTATSVLVNAGHTYDLKGVFWIQGGSDSNSEMADAYQANLTAFISRLRTDLDAPELPIILGVNAPDDTYRIVVRNAQIAVADADAAVDWVETSDFGRLPDGLHYDAAGNLLLGERLARAFLRQTDGFYSNWSEHYDWDETPLNQRAPEADPDGDGLSNAAERALGADPLLADAQNAIRKVIDVPEAGGVQFRLAYRKGAAEMSYQLKHTVSLQMDSSWSAEGVSDEAFDDILGEYYQTWTAPALQDKAFVRLLMTD